jgi:hypothetical protein
MAVSQATVTPSAASIQPKDNLPAIQLALAFTDALNDHNVGALVDLFTDEDGGPTVNADRDAWQRFEIREWARQ